MESQNEKRTNVSNSPNSNTSRSGIGNDATKKSFSNTSGTSKSDIGNNYDKKDFSTTSKSDSGNERADTDVNKTSRSERGSNTNKRSYAGRDNDHEGELLSTLRENKKSILGVLGAVVGGALLYKGAKSLGGSKKSKSKTVTASSKSTINQPRPQLYAYWRNLENLPNFMSHIKEVRETGNKRSEWTAKIPGGMGTIEWDAEIIQERTNHLIMWRSLPGSEIENSGQVRFEIDPKGRGTVVETTITYTPPAGNAGDYAAKLITPAFEKVLKKDLKQFKKFMEKGGADRRNSQPSLKV